MRTITIFIGVLSLFLFVTGCQKGNQQEPEFAEVPDLPNAFPQSSAMNQPVEAPDFKVTTLEGDPLNLSDLRGKTVLLNFWATWCGPCIAEIPDLIKLQEELGTEEFAVVGLSMDMIEASIVQEFVESMEINYPIAIDEGEIADEFGGVFSLPTTFVIDKEGTIKQRTIGIFPAEAYKPHLVSMIEGG